MNLKQKTNWPLQSRPAMPSTDELLAYGEIALLNEEKVAAFSYFEAAIHLAPSNSDVWTRSALSLFEFGKSKKNVELILQANRHFKQAIQLAPQNYAIWASWGSALLHLGMASREHHFFLEAKEKFQRAIEELKEDSPSIANLYWEYGLVWTELANHSEEALDIRLAIQAFRTSLNYCSTPSIQLLSDCGNAYLQMGLLTNDSRSYNQAIDLFERALAINSEEPDVWMLLAETYSQLYLNTLDERIAVKGMDCYAWLTNKDPKSGEAWLGWAQLLGESGRINRDEKKIQSSIEKCVAGTLIDPEHPLLIAQWVESLSLIGAIANRLDLLIEAEQKILDATDRFPDHPDLWHAYGLCLIGFGHYYNDPDYYDLAIEKLQEGLSMDRSHAELWHALALAHMHCAQLTNDLDMIERSTRFYTFALDLKPACPSLIFDAANAWLLSCDLHDDAKDLEKAIELYEVLLQQQKDALLNHPEWLFQYAIALEWLGDFTHDEWQIIRAIDLFLHVLLIDPELPQIHFRLAICFTYLGETSSALEYFQRAEHHFRFAIRQDEEDANVWLEWGICNLSSAHRNPDPDVAQQIYAESEQKILRAGQLGSIQAYYHLACLYSLLGRCEEAMQLLLKAQKSSALPLIEELIENEWLDNLRQTEMFAQFLSSLEPNY